MFLGTARFPVTDPKLYFKNNFTFALISEKDKSGEEDKQCIFTEDVEEEDDQSMITVENCTRSDSVIIPIRDVASAICLISWKEHTEENKKEAVGTAFLCSLPKNLGYKAVLLSAGQNFKQRELTPVGQSLFLQHKGNSK